METQIAVNPTNREYLITDASAEQLDSFDSFKAVMIDGVAGNIIREYSLPKPDGLTQVAILKWDGKWMCLTLSALYVYKREILNQLLDEEGRNLEDEPSFTHPIDPKISQVIWNDRKGKCRITPFQTILDGWTHTPPKFKLLTSSNQANLFNKLYKQIYPQYENKIPHLDIIGAVDSVSLRSRAVETNLLNSLGVEVSQDILDTLENTLKFEARTKESEEKIKTNMKAMIKRPNIDGKGK